MVIPLIEDCSGKKAGVDFGVGTNPEFLRESTAIKGLDFPPMTVIGELDKQTGDLLEEIYRELDAPIIRKTVEVAEMIKYTCNVWHAAKVTFANEIGNIAAAVGVDGREVMDVICQDHKLNLSRYYMRPGFAFGGSSCPGCTRPHLSRQPAGRRAPDARFVDAQQLQPGAEGLRSHHQPRHPQGRPARACRSRPAPTICAKARWWSWPRCSSAGYELRIFDRNVEYARVHGANKEYPSSRRSRTSPHCWSGPRRSGGEFRCAGAGQWRRAVSSTW